MEFDKTMHFEVEREENTKCQEVLKDVYKSLVEKNESKKNENAKNIEQIAISDKYTVSDKVKEIFKELVRKKSFVFNKLFSLKERPKEEVVTAFSGVLELSRRNKIFAQQEKNFGDITIKKRNKNE